MPKTGAFRTGEGPSGDIAELVLAAATQTLDLATPMQTLTGSGAATVDAPVQNHQITTSATTVGLVFALQSATQTLTISSPTPSISGTGIVTASATAHTLNHTHPDPQLGYDEWVLDNDVIGTVTTETATWQTLTLRSRVTTTTLTNTLRDLKSDEGQVDVLETDTGGFTAVGRANGGNTFSLIPPVYRQPLRASGNVHVSRYEEDLVSQSVDEWDVELELVKDANRTDTPSISETAGVNEWELVTPLGTIATDRVDAEFLGTGADGVERFELTARFTFEQAHAWEAAYNQQAGVRVRVIPDETNIAVDDTTSASQTLGVTAPTSGSEVPTGEYVVMGWESTRLNDAFQQVTVTIADAG